jgi:hypothetical protein
MSPSRCIPDPSGKHPRDNVRREGGLLVIICCYGPQNRVPTSGNAMKTGDIESVTSSRRDEGWTGRRDFIDGLCDGDIIPTLDELNPCSPVCRIEVSNILLSYLLFSLALCQTHTHYCLENVI